MAKKCSLLIEPGYRVQVPPFGLMKISSWRKSLGEDIASCHGNAPWLRKDKPDSVFITSLFTYQWENVANSASYYKALFPDAEFHLGGIYASLMPEHAKKHTGIEPHKGLLEESEPFPPDLAQFSSWPGSNASYAFTTRGCPNSCKFCGSKKICKDFRIVEGWESHIDPARPLIVLHDENITAAPFEHYKSVMQFLAASKKPVLFNNGFDCRLFTEDHADLLAKVKNKSVRFAFDTMAQDGYIQDAIRMCLKRKIARSDMLVYILHNFNDTIDDAMYRAKEVHALGVKPYPMRYKPLDWLTPKKRYVSPKWTERDVIDFYNYWKSFVAPNKVTFEEWKATGRNYAHSNRRARQLLKSKDKSNRF